MFTIAIDPLSTTNPPKGGFFLPDIPGRDRVYLSTRVRERGSDWDLALVREHASTTRTHRAQLDIPSELFANN